MATPPLIGIAPLQHNPRNALLDVGPMTRALNEYRRVADVERRFPLQRDAMLAQLDQTRAQTSLTAAQQAAAEAAMRRGETLLPLQQRNMMLQSDHLRAQTGLTAAQAAAAQRNAQTQAAIMEALASRGMLPPTAAATGLSPHQSLSTYSNLLRLMSDGDFTYTPSE